MGLIKAFQASTIKKISKTYRCRPECCFGVCNSRVGQNADVKIGAKNNHIIFHTVFWSMCVLLLNAVVRVEDVVLCDVVAQYWRPVVVARAELKEEGHFQC